MEVIEHPQRNLELIDDLIRRGEPSLLERPFQPLFVASFHFGKRGASICDIFVYLPATFDDVISVSANLRRPAPDFIITQTPLI